MLQHKRHHHAIHEDNDKEKTHPQSFTTGHHTSSFELSGSHTQSNSGWGPKKNDEEKYSLTFGSWMRMIYNGSFILMMAGLVVFIFMIAFSIFGIAEPHIPVQNIPSYAMQYNSSMYFEVVSGSPYALTSLAVVNTTFGASVCQLAKVFTGTTCSDETMFFDLYLPMFSNVAMINQQNELFSGFINTYTAVPIKFLLFLGCLIFILFLFITTIFSFVPFEKDTFQKSLYGRICETLWMDPFRLLAGLAVDLTCGIILIRVAGIASQTSMYLILVFMLYKHILYVFFDFKLGYGVTGGPKNQAYINEKSADRRLFFTTLLLVFTLMFMSLVVAVRIGFSARNDGIDSWAWAQIAQPYEPGCGATAFALLMTVLFFFCCLIA